MSGLSFRGRRRIQPARSIQLSITLIVKVETVDKLCMPFTPFNVSNSHFISEEQMIASVFLV
ncbi:hypothetical protein [Cohnella lupini]|uniref:hypothetical protein n=1 Tax=Cohnella lupini TaxID=1294267 RepID=UPI0011C02FCB|nr:hypothetical protein [Cohnella lupini]